jgi:hypothetical protein
VAAPAAKPNGNGFALEMGTAEDSLDAEFRRH